MDSAVATDAPPALAAVPDDELLEIEDLEERSELVHGVCACTTSCGCTSTSCVGWL